MGIHPEWQHTITNLDIKIATALLKIISRASRDLAKVVNLREEEAAKYRRLISGRQIAWVIYFHYRMSKTDICITEFKDLINIKLKTGAKGFLRDWDYCLLGMREQPPDNYLESLFRHEIENTQHSNT